MKRSIFRFDLDIKMQKNEFLILISFNGGADD